MKIERYLLILLSVLYVTVILVSKIPKAMDSAVDKAVDQNKDFVHQYNVCDITLQSKKYQEAADCFEEMLRKYDRNDVRYNYAAALAQLKKYKKAKDELEFIIKNEKNFTQVVEQAKSLDKQIEDILSKMREEAKDYSDVEQNQLDFGDYLPDLKEYMLWKNHHEITVYIQDDPKKELYQKAFNQWSTEIGDRINFKYVDTKDANITAFYVDTISADEGGKTDVIYSENRNGKYLDKAIIQVAKRSSRDKKELTDEQLYSIILHEIGHALGVSGHSPFKGDIMYFSTDSFLNEKGIISKRDVNTVRKMYR